MALGDTQRAKRLLREALTRSPEVSDLRLIGLALLLTGVVALQEGDPARGVRLVGAVGAILALTQFDRSGRTDVEASLARARATLSEATYARAWAEGRAMTLDQAIACAMSDEGRDDASVLIPSEEGPSDRGRSPSMLEETRASEEGVQPATA